MQDVETTFYLVQACQPSVSDPAGASNVKLTKSLIDAAMENLDTLSAAIESEFRNPKHHFETFAVADTLVDAVMKTAYQQDVHLIVMGTRGKSSLKKLIFGSNTLKIIDEVRQCPVLAIPSDCPLERPEKILFASGFEHIFDKHELVPLIEIAALSKASVKVFHVVNPKKVPYYRENVKKVLAKRFYNTPYEIIETPKTGAITTEIENALQSDSSIGMIAIMDYWHSFVEKLTTERIVRNVGLQSKVPILVVHMTE